jgi:hypothetical protein
MDGSCSLADCPPNVSGFAPPPSDGTRGAAQVILIVILLGGAPPGLSLTCTTALTVRWRRS